MPLHQFRQRDRCRNCGYEFSLAAEPQPVDLPIQIGDEPVGPMRDLDAERRAATAGTRRRVGVPPSPPLRPIAPRPPAASICRSSPIARRRTTRRSSLPAPRLVSRCRSAAHRRHRPSRASSSPPRPRCWRTTRRSAVQSPTRRRTLRCRRATASCALSVRRCRCGRPARPPPISSSLRRCRDSSPAASTC